MTLAKRPPDAVAVSLRCAHCHHEAVQKVTAICRAGTSTAGVATTELAGLLAAPPEPRDPVAGRLVGIGCGSVLAFAVAMAFGAMSHPLAFIAVIAVIVPLAGYFAGRVQTDDRSSLEGARGRHQLQMARWNELVYCPRCDRVSHPASGESASPEKMQSLLDS